MKQNLNLINLALVVAFVIGAVFLELSAVTQQAAGTISGTVAVSQARTSADVVVYLEKVGNNNFAPPKERAIMDQKNKVFIPHVLPVLKGTVVDFPNSDNVRHNVYSPPEAAQQFNLGTYDMGVVKQVTFDKPGVVQLLCNVHTEMSAYVVVLPNPYFAKTDRRGEFTIKNVPPGRYTLKTWHERMASVSQDITVEAGQTAQVNLTLKGRK